MFGAVPVAKGDVVDGIGRETGEIDPIHRGWGSLFVVLLRAETLDGAVSENDARKIRRE